MSRFDLLFPTRLLTKIFRHCKHNAWVEWLMQDLGDMRVIRPDGSVESFLNVSQFEFLGDGTVMIKTKDCASFEMMTRTPDGKSIEKECARRGLRDISIDHVDPLEKVLRLNKNSHVGLRRLTELFDEFKTSIGRELNPRAEIDWVNGFYDYICKKLNMDDLRASITHDLEVLELKYELMDTRYNSIRGNG